ncbi:MULTISPECIES: class I SAM-dependent methyltransferase [Pseudonocardia]|uniref:Methyltransferase domain protein n=2 Tax=Pseudonocardia TaxID=1847 RepID=A0A1Y2MV78_PSEAH|nr:MULTISPECIES: methyltransferase domain-containing protein [Pseudonocardia]OSY38697.1 Methyltransferase domain protein [Pseudonocardia autotrophica]TDN74899.1 methyltransferase family protein [Pseudonocardia autotrophica]BBF98838.1 methyltransferase type 11 [Pseudonocardia autotrophica]GEC26556.1 methyltransferase type 11 [Pseudonocardia saturnea]
MSDVYAGLSTGYATRRRPDPRIAERIETALGAARTVVNVGAGAGSYEPADRRVLAVDPSTSMLAQRPAGAAPAVRATAEAVPVRDDGADAALAVLTVHHWSDAGAGLAELRRIAPRQVVLTWDPGVMARFWLVEEYLPDIVAAESELATLDEVVAGLRAPGGSVTVETVPVPADCTDGFLCAYWNRPESYLDPARRTAISAFARIPAAAVHDAVGRLSDDLATGRWDARHGHLRSLASVDPGYRLVTATRDGAGTGHG